MKKLLLLLSFVIAGCGGGGGSSSNTTNTPQNAGIFNQPVKYVAPTEPTQLATLVKSKMLTATMLPNVSKIPTYDPVTKSLILPSVSIDDVMYGKIILHLDSDGAFSLNNSPILDSAIVSHSSYNLGYLIIHSLIVEGHRYANATLHLNAAGKFVLVSVFDPIIVKPTSYENKNIDMEPTVLPITNAGTWAGMQNWHARAWADFEQNGTYSYFVAKNNNSQSDMFRPGLMFFFHHNTDGTYTDITNTMLDNKEDSCIGPMRSLIADFNNDGIPDILVTCTGPDFEIPANQAGENSMILMSQPNGKYHISKINLGGHTYIHGAAIADINSDGYPDIVVADVSQNLNNNSPVYALINNKDGSFSKKNIGFDFLTWQGVWTLDMVDIDGDGKPELWIGGARSPDSFTYRASSFYKMDGKGGFIQTPVKSFPLSTEFNIDYDIVVFNGKAYVLSQNEIYTASSITQMNMSNNIHQIIFTNYKNYGSLFLTISSCKGISGATIENIRLYGNKIVTDDSCRNPNILIN
jgi:hypothetical protein